jgi:hypothetical protein
MTLLAIAQSAVEQLSPMTVFVTLCAAVTTLFGALLVLFKHMIDNDKRKTDVLERQHEVLSQWFATADKRLDRILDKVSEK